MKSELISEQDEKTYAIIFDSGDEVKKVCLNSPKKML